MAYSKAEAKEKLREFLGRYKRHEQEGKLGKLKEENTKDYLDELFRILGWDIIDDVIKEYGTGKKKRVDYAFHIKGITKFLLEAKAYGEDIQEKHIAQALQYGYLNNKTWVVLTNLREIRIYNAKYFDKEEQIRQLFSPIRLDHALERFDDLWLISREAMAQGLINEVASKYGKIRPREAVDKKIFEDLMDWRWLLTKNISKNNKFEGATDESKEKIDEAVQKILDRIIFARVCEDRGLEEEGMLKWCITQSKEEGKYALSKYLNRQFSRLNGAYNSGLFAPHFSEELSVDDKVLERIIEETYESPDGLRYDFSAIDADILGTVYEQYLGSSPKKTEKNTVIKGGKAHRKKMGIYYTPIYVVDYIVKNTVGERLKKCRTPEEALKIRVLDPACGSGSFLIRAYDEFRRWFETYKMKSKSGGKEQTILSMSGKNNIQTFMDRVLENCIYGVDLDTKAVELAQLNLLLKSAEDKHKLPKLDHTIRNGNSLIDESQVVGKRAFRWEENFPEVFKDGGFDVIIGNPPWVRAKVSCSEAELEELKRKYGAYSVGELNLYKLFMIRSLKLLKKTGRFSFITPNSYLSDRDSQELRKWILNEFWIKKLLTFSEKATKSMFEITQATSIAIIEKQEKKPDDKTMEVSELLNETEAFATHNVRLFSIPQSSFLKNKDAQIFVGKSKKEIKVMERLSEKPKLGTIITTRDGEIHLTKYSRFITDYGSEKCALLVRGNHLSRYRVDLRKNNRPGGWIKLIGLSVSNEMHKTKRIVVQQVSNMAQRYRIKGGIIEPGIYAGNSCVSVISNDGTYSLEYLLALLNSKLMNYYFKFFSSTNHVTGRELQGLPLSTPNDQQKKRIEELTKKMIEIQAKTAGKKQNSNEMRLLENEVMKVDAEIDNLIYDIYTLTKDEKEIIEAST